MGGGFYLFMLFYILSLLRFRNVFVFWFKSVIRFGNGYLAVLFYGLGERGWSLVRFTLLGLEGCGYFLWGSISGLGVRVGFLFLGICMGFDL